MHCELLTVAANSISNIVSELDSPGWEHVQGAWKCHHKLAAMGGDTKRQNGSRIHDQQSSAKGPFKFCVYIWHPDFIAINVCLCTFITIVSQWITLKL